MSPLSTAHHLPRTILQPDPTLHVSPNPTMSQVKVIDMSNPLLQDFVRVDLEG